jgi:hypothetical protein
MLGAEALGDWSWKVVHKNAPGAMSAIALMVTPTRPRVGFNPPELDDCVLVMRLIRDFKTILRVLIVHLPFGFGSK